VEDFPFIKIDCIIYGFIKKLGETVKFTNIFSTIFLAFSICGCNQLTENNKKFFALYKFQDPIFERPAPKVTKLKDSEINISETDFSLTEEDKRALKEAEALLNEPTISFDN
tara:strand:- start:1713 stop:2048 length:336 start_codon:yes stop_codon:yes gene_type:complete